MKLTSIFCAATSLWLSAASTGFSAPMMEGDSDSSSAPIPIVIPVVGTLDDLPNLAALESNVEANTAEITLLNDKILSVNPEDTEKPVHKQLFLTIFDAKTYKFHKQELRTKHGQEDGIIFIFEMSVIDEERLVSGDTEKNAVDALSNDSEDANERVAINNPSIAWSQPFKSCFMAAWQPGGVLNLLIWLPESCAQILDEFAVGAYLEDIARRLGAVEIIHKDKQTTTLFAPPNMLGYDADTGKWLGDPNSVEIRTPLWNLIMNGREETVPITTRMSPLGFQLDTKTYYPYIAPTTEDQLAAKNVLLNTRAAELATGFSTDPEDTAVSIVNGIFEKHADYLEKHSVVDLIRELYLNRDVSAENGEDARLLLKLLFGVVWSMMDNCRPWVNGDFVYNGTEGVPFLDASYKFQNWTPLTKSLL